MLNFILNILKKNVEILKSFMIKFKLKTPKNINNSKLIDFFKKIGLKELISLSKTKGKGVNEMISKNPYKPELRDLYNLYNYIILNKRITVLEFGSGWSSMVILLALNELKTKYSKEVTKLRRNNPFELFILENERKYFQITKKKIKKFIKKKNIKVKVNFCFSKVNMINYKGNIASEYQNLPLCNPDFVYIDGPDQFNIYKKINGININHKDMMPMICDPLKFEYFYTPGTIILSDGRAANIKFLKDNFKRNWLYKNDVKNDQHIFVLKDPCLGKYNKRQLDFYK